MYDGMSENKIRCFRPLSTRKIVFRLTWLFSLSFSIQIKPQHSNFLGKVQIDGHMQRHIWKQLNPFFARKFFSGFIFENWMPMICFFICFIFFRLSVKICTIQLVGQQTQIEERESEIVSVRELIVLKWWNLLFWWCEPYWNVLQFVFFLLFSDSVEFLSLLEFWPKHTFHLQVNRKNVTVN